MAVKSHSYVLVDGDDWQALYVDGVLYAEGHDITLYDFVEATGLKLDRRYNVDQQWHEEGNFPENLVDVKFA